MSNEENLSALRDKYVEQFIELRQLWNDVFESMTAEDWEKPHGADWVMPFLPYHLEYFDRQIILAPISLGEDYPEDNRPAWKDQADINAWNIPFIETFDPQIDPQIHITAWRATQQEILDLLNSLDEDELANRKVWHPLNGWMNVIDVLAGTIPHNWNHLNEVYIHLGRSSELPSIGYGLTRTGLGFYTNIFVMFMLNHEAVTEPIKIAMVYTGDERLKWTIDIRDGAYTIHEGVDEDATIIVTQSPFSLIKTLTGNQNSGLAIQAGDIVLNDMKQLDKLIHYFPVFAV